MPRTALATLAAALVLGAPAQAETIGRSSEGRAITLTRAGDPEADAKVLVVGSIHGNEQAGRAVIRRLRRARPTGLELLLVDDANPDGSRRGTRQNARGVDLNRNFPYRWRRAGRRGGVHWPGPRPASEPETRALMRLVERERPRVTIWYHQALALTNYSHGADGRIVRRYARLSGLPARSLPFYRGTATSWQNHAFRRADAFVVELPGGMLSPDAARRHERAVLSLLTR